MRIRKSRNRAIIGETFVQIAAVNAPPAEVLAAARALPKIRESLQSQKVIKEIHVPGRMVSFVTAPINGNGGDK